MVRMWASWRVTRDTARKSSSSYLACYATFLPKTLPPTCPVPPPVPPSAVVTPTTARSSLSDVGGWEHVKRVVGEGVEVCPVPGSLSFALDLFFRTGSVGDQLKKRGFSVVSLDFQRSAKADFILDILEWDYKKAFEPGHFALIAAVSPAPNILML